MSKINLQNGFTLSVGPHNNKLRLIVEKDNEEYVCRIEDGRKLHASLAPAMARTFLRDACNCTRKPGL